MLQKTTRIKTKRRSKLIPKTPNLFKMVDYFNAVLCLFISLLIMTSAAAPVNSNNNDTAMTTTPAMGNMAIATNGQTTEKTTIEPVVSVKIFLFF